MELKPKYRKVKLKLVQPQIKCNGRDDVTCIYRGKVIQETEKEMFIEIKVYGIKTLIEYRKEFDKCITFGFEDLILL